MLGEEINKRLEFLKKSAQDFYIFVNSVDGKKIVRESDISTLEAKIEKLKKTHDENQNKATALIQSAQEESSKRISDSKLMMENAANAKNQAQKEKEEAQKIMNEAQALMAQARQRQKEADIAYNQYEDKKKKLFEAVR